MEPEQLRLYYPVKPFNIIQPFGGNPGYYKKFKDKYGQSMKGHMGIDIEAAHGTPVYASVDGIIRFVRDEHGGEGMYINTGARLYHNAGDSFDVIHWHLIGDTDPKYPPPLRTDGIWRSVKVGDLIGYADNTGAPFESTGDHLHLGLIPVDSTNGAIEAVNGFNGCIDPTPYLCGLYAEDVPGFISKLTALVEALRKYLTSKGK